MKLTFKNVLITGGAGFIGSNIASKLVDKGVSVTVLDSLSEQIHGQKPEETSPLYLSIKDKVKFIKGSVTSREDWLKAIDGQEAIIHLAAETGTGQSMYEIEKYVNTNIGGTALMLDILTNAKHNVKRVLLLKVVPSMEKANTIAHYWEKMCIRKNAWTRICAKENLNVLILMLESCN